MSHQGTTLGPVWGLRILGTGAAMPVDIDPSCAPLDTDDAYRLLGLLPPPDAARSGVSTRQWAALPGGTPRISALQLAVLAAERALRDAGLSRVDVLHVATSTPDRVSASLAAQVAHGIGHRGLSVDVRGGGAGALLAWIEAVGLLQMGAKTALVVGVEEISPFLAPGDRGSALYGDGSGALVIGPGAADRGLERALTGVVPLMGRAFSVPGPLPPTPDGDYTFRTPDVTYRDALRAVRLDAARALSGVVPKLDHLLAYGATQPSIDEMSGVFGVTAHTTLRETGCLGNAALLVALHVHRAQILGPPRRPARTGAVAAAGGAVWAALSWID